MEGMNAESISLTVASALEHQVSHAIASARFIPNVCEGSSVEGNAVRPFASALAQYLRIIMNAPRIGIQRAPHIFMLSRLSRLSREHAREAQSREAIALSFSRGASVRDLLRVLREQFTFICRHALTSRCHLAFTSFAALQETIPVAAHVR